jgi:cobalt-precorrin-5B (C1)-methyltransferase
MTTPTQFPPVAAETRDAPTANAHRDRRGLRTGFTTGACAAAAAKAATRLLVQGGTLSTIETTLPNRLKVTFSLSRSERTATGAIASVVKDAGDDPDCTHGAEIVADVCLSMQSGVLILGGVGVATVTKPGLGLEVGGPAINPVPRRNITEMVAEELAGSAWPGAVVRIAVPGGEEMAKKTTNARLGLVGGISILGTSGIVKPFSTAAYRASVVQAIDVARERALAEIVLTTGGKSEAYAMKLHPHLPVEAFVQVGDFVGTGLRHCARRRAQRAIVVGMIGKLSKMADGKMMTHAAGSEVNTDLLATLAAELGAGQDLCTQIRAANTARHVLELCAAHRITGIAALICRRVVENGSAHAGGDLEVRALLVDFDGSLLGRYPPSEPDDLLSAPTETTTP